MQAACQGHLAVVDCLMAHGADVNIPDVHGRTARELAKHANRMEVARRIPKPVDDSGEVKLQKMIAKASSGSASTTASTCASPSDAKKGTRPASVGSAPRDPGQFVY
jgi:ankyrin repeat protein